MARTTARVLRLHSGRRRHAAPAAAARTASAAMAHSEDEAFGDLGAVLEFMRLLWSMDHALQRRSKRMERVLGITGPQRLAVRIIGRFPGISAGQLARLLHVHPSTITGVLARLEKNRFIERRSDPNDSRRSLLRLTRRGADLNASTRGTVESAVAQVIGRASAVDVRAAKNLLTAVARSLDRTL